MLTKLLRNSRKCIMKLIFIKKGTITETEKETNIQVDNITLVGEYCTLVELSLKQNRGLY